ncbi:C1 family peptidase [Spongiimicrobium sp. 3-5]|uniref:C1 family peptidase n=1 Tax=Spongiimicrobium sp. 3-5 TaxID=3332596 RepID=UPI00397F3926
MRKTKFFCLIVILMISCEFEPVGSGSLLESSNEDSEFATGGICIGNGEYGNHNASVLVNFDVPDDLPDNFDLSHLLPPIRNQGQQGSCVSWAISYYMKSLQEKIESETDFTVSDVTSPAYTYNQITKGNCAETAIVETLDLLKTKGVCSWSSFPYSDTNCDRQPTEEHDEQALQNRISDYKCLSGENMVNEMKGLINQQTPVIILAYLSSEFGKTDNFGLTAYREHLVDYSLGRCHAMLVVGYSDKYNAFKVVNSWGTDWGDNGFVWIDYAAFDNVINETAEFRVINQAYVAYDF